MRVFVEYRTASKDNYIDFCKKHPDIILTFDEWRNIIYTYTEMFKQYVLETGKDAKLAAGFGKFYINKRKRQKIKIVNGKERVNLPIDWKKTKERGKVVYNFNFHTEGYFFGWTWMKRSCTIKFSNLWWFKPSRETSRLLSHYLKIDKKYQYLYVERVNNKKIN